MNDSDVLTGYANECVDVNGYGTCYAYSINLTNFGEKGTLLSEMNTTVTGIQNLKYIVLNSSDLSVYQPITSVVEGELQSLGPNFTLNTNETASYIIIFWISNLNQNQIGQDAGGTFDSDLTFRAVRSTEGGTISSKVTGTKK